MTRPGPATVRADDRRGRRAIERRRDRRREIEVANQHRFMPAVRRRSLQPATRDSEHRPLAIGSPQALQAFDDVAHRRPGRDQARSSPGGCSRARPPRRRRGGRAARSTLALSRSRRTRCEAGDLALGRRRIVGMGLDVEALVRFDVLVDADHRLVAARLALGRCRRRSPQSAAGTSPPRSA